MFMDSHVYGVVLGQEAFTKVGLEVAKGMQVQVRGEVGEAVEKAWQI